jgi:hypothetical protein
MGAIRAEMENLNKIPTNSQPGNSPAATYTGKTTFTVLKKAERGGTIETRLYRKGTYILADIHGMDHFCTNSATTI